MSDQARGNLRAVVSYNDMVKPFSEKEGQGITGPAFKLFHLTLVAWCDLSLKLSS